MRTKVRVSQAAVEALAEASADAYSADGYRSWRAVCRMLLERGYDALQAEAILRSKWTRWAQDNATFYGRKGNGDCTATDLARWLDKGGVVDITEVEDLTEETFGFRSLAAKERAEREEA